MIYGGKWAEPESNRRHMDFQSTISGHENRILDAASAEKSPLYNAPYNGMGGVMDSWPPPKPRNFEFTPHIRGWAKWYKGQTRIIPIKSLDRATIREEWDRRKKEIDGVQPHQSTNRGTYAETVSAYYQWLDHRVMTGEPEPLSPHSREDAKRTLSALGAVAGVDRPISDFGPEQFSAFAISLAGHAASTRARHVANVGAFFRWAVDERLLAAMPAFGRYFVRPSQQATRDVRLTQAKSFTADEIGRMWRAGNHVDRTWICLGLNGALDNADLANLPLPEAGGVLDLDAGVLDYRRRKTGKVRRVIPLLPTTVMFLRHYLKRHRPEPASAADAWRFFLTDHGHPLGRFVASETRLGRENAIDAVARRWQRVMIAAGLRQAPKVTTTGKGATRRRTLQFVGDSDRRGFRSFRTTFANFAPVGFGDEVEIVMGHSRGSMLVENYLETVGMGRLTELVSAVWRRSFPAPPDAAPGPAVGE